ncbi:MAG TPA: AAA family ATPase, partial [Blastocatellia bacterium]
VPFGAGGGTDALARVFADAAKKYLPQPIISGRLLPPSSADFYLGRLQTLAKLRGLIRGLSHVVTIAADSSEPVQERVDKLVNVVLGLKSEVITSSHATCPMVRADALGDIPISRILDSAGVFRAGSKHLFFGAPGDGKTKVFLDAALGLAQQVGIVYVVAEALEEVPAFIAAWCDFYKCGTGRLFIYKEPVQLGQPASVDRFLRYLKNLPGAVALIFYDPLINCMVGLSDADATDAATVNQGLDQIFRATGAAQVVIHHSGWMDGRERGSSAWRGFCRVVGRVAKTSDGRLEFTPEKQNNAPFKARYFRFLETGGTVLPIRASRIALTQGPVSKAEWQILDCLNLATFKNGARHTDIRETTSMAVGSISRTLDLLIKRGYVAQPAGRGAAYQLTDPGREIAYQGPPDEDPTPSSSENHKFNWHSNLEEFSANSSGNGQFSRSFPGLFSADSNSRASIPANSAVFQEDSIAGSANSIPPHVCKDMGAEFEGNAGSEQEEF